MVKKTLVMTVFTATSLAASAAVQAADYPTQPIRLIVGFSAGGATDVSARLFARKMSDLLGQSVVVENKPGAAGTISADFVAKSKPDGYTILYTSSSIHGISPHLYDDLKWDPVKDFAPIALAAKYPQVLLANKEFPAADLPAFLSLAKDNPNKYSYASAGVGGTQHMAAAILSSQANLEMVHIPYKGMSAAYPDLMAGRVQVMFDNAPSAIPFVQGDKTRALAVSSEERITALPDTPTVKELGFPDYVVNAWTGFVAPAGTSPAVIEKLNQVIVQSSEDPEIQRWLHENGSPTNISGTPTEFASFMANELEFWGKAVELSGAKQK